MGVCEGSDAVVRNGNRVKKPDSGLGPVAQLGERLVCIQEVVGSIPVGSTTAEVQVRCPSAEVTRAYSSVWLERTPDKREVGGSNPPRPTTFFVFGEKRRGKDLS